MDEMTARPQRIAEAEMPVAAGEGSRAEILEAAALCFMERGYQATSIDDVARRLGATKGRVYHHYPSKADLFADIFRAGMDMNFAAIAPCLEGSSDPLGRLRAMAAVHTRQMIRTRAYQRVVWEGVEMHLRGATTPQQREAFTRLQQHRDDYEKLFRDAIAAGRDAGQLSFDSLGVASQLLFISLNSPIFWYSPRAGETEADTERTANQIVAYALRGLGAKVED